MTSSALISYKPQTLHPKPLSPTPHGPWQPLLVVGLEHVVLGEAMDQGFRIQVLELRI